MSGIINDTLRAYERWLRIDATADALTAARARALCAFSWVFASSQLINMLGMALDYGGWTSDHWVASVAFAAVMLACHSMRWSKRFELHAVSYCSAMILCVLMASTTSGINSALLPMLAWGPLACGLVAGWRSVIAVSTGIMVLTANLYAVSVTGDPALLTGREFQRLFQTNLAVVVTGALATVFSFTLRRALTDFGVAAERAKKAEAAKSDFLARMSHELRTPLGGVIGLADALAASDLAPRERTLTETIRGSGESMLAILNDLLDLSKIEAGMLRLEPAPVDVRALTVSIADTWTEGAAAKGTALEARVADDVPAWVEGDALRMRQILNNFVSNAVKFTAGGTVRLDVARDGERLAFTVTDTGRGVPEAKRDAIFEPFDQGAAGTTADYGGTGLGLPICRDLAALMDGRVALVSSGAEGSTFAFTVPLPPCAPPADQADADVDALSGLRVLVADDNAVNRMVAAEFLRALSVEAVFAEDGEEAVEAARVGGFDAILMDKHMPRLDGLGATAAIRALPGEAGRVPIVAVTADAMVGEREAMLAGGMDGFLSKPLRLPALRDALATATTDRALRRAG